MRHYQVTQLKIGDICWRASEASETLSGVTQSRFRYIYLLASERSERDTYRGNTIENWGCLLASETVLGVDNAKSGICYMYVCMYGLYVCPLNARAGNFFLQKNTNF